MDPKRAINGTFCPLPWTGFIMNPDGEVKNCVFSTEILGNINDNNIEEILQGNVNTNIKQCMNTDQEHPGCAKCYKLEKGASKLKNVRSDRYYYLKELSSIPYSTYNTMDTKLSTVDMRWRNTCNLACVYCGPEFSSTWAKELGVDISIDETQLAKTKQYVLENAPNLKNVYLAGGEPLLMKENVELLDRLDPSCTVRINTNLINLRSPVYKHASKFRNVHWTVSVETMGAEFEYIRYGAMWNTFLENLNVIKKLDHKISFNMLWFVLNPYSVFDTIDYFIDCGYSENAFVIGPITGPGLFDVRNLNDHTIADLKQVLKNRIHRADSRYLLHNSYINMLKHLDEKFDKKSSKTIQRLEEMDKRRGLNYKNVFDIDKYL